MKLSKERIEAIRADNEALRPPKVGDGTIRKLLAHVDALNQEIEAYDSVIDRVSEAMLGLPKQERGQ